jgi:hypothetical protein
MIYIHGYSKLKPYLFKHHYKEKMTKIYVDAVAARGLTGDSELKGLNGTYLQRSIGNPLTGQKQKTKPQQGLGTEISFGESFEFDANESDSLRIKLFEDEFLWDEKLGEAVIPLKGMFETGGTMGAWFPFGEEKSEGGEVLLNIATTNED